MEVSGAMVSLEWGEDLVRYIRRSWNGSLHSVSGFLTAPTNAEPTRKEVLARVDWRRWRVSRNSTVLASRSLVLASRSLVLTLNRFLRPVE